MKRSGPLRRTRALVARTPLARGKPLGRTAPLPAQRTPLARRTPLVARSAKMARVYDESRRPLVVELLAAHPKCQLRVKCSGDPAVDVHELLTRARSASTAQAITDRRNCLTACRKCHDWVDNHPAAAQCLGLLLPSWAENAHDDPWRAAAALRGTRVGPCPWRPCGGPCSSTDASQKLACESSWVPDGAGRVDTTEDRP